MTTTWRKKVPVSVQVEEEEIGETHGKEQGEEQRVKERTTASTWDVHVDDMRRARADT